MWELQAAEKESSLYKCICFVWSSRVWHWLVCSPKGSHIPQHTLNLFLSPQQCKWCCTRCKSQVNCVNPDAAYKEGGGAMTKCWKESGRALESWTWGSGSPSAVREGHICCCKGHSIPLRPSLNSRNRSSFPGQGKLRQSSQQPTVIFLPEVPCEMPGKYLFTELSLEAQCKKLHLRKRPK